MTNRREPIHARAQIRGNGLAPRLAGEATFTQRPNGVLVTVRVVGLPLKSPSGFFALNIHEGTSCDGENLSDTHAPFDPAFAAHLRRAGDLPPLLACGSEAYLCVMTDRFSLRDVIGRTIVIRSGANDFRQISPGRAGEKIACGVIRRTQR